MATNDIVVIRRFRELPLAEVARGALLAAGIPAELRNPNVAAIDWFYSDAIGGISLVVPAECAQDAEAILSAQAHYEVPPQSRESTRDLAVAPPRPFASRRRVALYVLGATALLYLFLELFGVLRRL